MSVDDLKSATEQVESDNRYMIRRGSDVYPRALEQISNPPDQLYVVGSPRLLEKPALAIVGARKATPYGKGCSARFARMAVQHDIAVVSGGAIGCDQSAHRGALDGGGVTIVVLGCGADVTYPTRAKALFAEVVANGGCLVSELPWGSPPKRWAFVKRNRLIAALSQAVLIVEAGLPSGTFSTADSALQQGKEVWVVPGSIDSRQSRGSNQLLSQGAVPIIDDQCFCDTLVSTFGVSSRIKQTAARQNGDSRSTQTKILACDNGRVEIITALEATPSRPEALIGIQGWTVTEVIQQLSSLEIIGLVERLSDGRYAIRATSQTTNRYYGNRH